MERDPREEGSPLEGPGRSHGPALVLGILGPGNLGRSLARWAIACGFKVRLMGRDPAHAREGVRQVEGAWAEAAGKGRLDANRIPAFREALEARGPRDVEGLDILLEALPEDLEAKAGAWRALDPLLGPEVLRLTGSSALPLSAIGRAAGLGSPLLGFHLFLPVGRMAVVELVAAEGTPGADVDRALSFASALGLRAVRVKDQAGYAAARMALCQGLEAMRLVEAGVAEAEDLDALMVLGYGHPAGPLELSDRIGLDLRLRIAEHLLEATGDARYAPPAILRDLVARGHTGRRAGRGFHSWSPSGART